MDKPPTGIEQMIVDVGEPRNLAEQLLLAKMRQYATTEKRLGTHTAHVEWVKAFITMTAIFTYRENGDKPMVKHAAG